MRRMFFYLVFLLSVYGCEKVSVPEQKDPTMLTVDVVKLEELTNGAKVEKQVSVYINIFLIPQGRTVKSSQSIFDIGKGYILDTDNKEISVTYTERESDGFLPKVVDSGNYFVCVMRDDASLKYSYTTVNVPENKKTSIKKIFQSDYPKASFEAW